MVTDVAGFNKHNIKIMHLAWTGTEFAVLMDTHFKSTCTCITDMLDDRPLWFSACLLLCMSMFRLLPLAVFSAYLV